MSYFAPYLDGTGIHMPTYEDRMEDLREAYRNIFGTESELDPAVPDYQLLSVFAKALDDTSALVLQVYNSRIPVILHYIEGYEIRHVSEILKIPATTVKTRLSRGRTRLREILNEEALEEYET